MEPRTVLDLEPPVQTGKKVPERRSCPIIRALGRPRIVTPSPPTPESQEEEETAAGRMRAEVQFQKLRFERQVARGICVHFSGSSVAQFQKVQFESRLPGGFESRLAGAQ